MRETISTAVHPHIKTLIEKGAAERWPDVERYKQKHFGRDTRKSNYVEQALRLLVSCAEPDGFGDFCEDVESEAELGYQRVRLHVTIPADLKEQLYDRQTYYTTFTRMIHVGVLLLSGISQAGRRNILGNDVIPESVVFSSLKKILEQENAKYIDGLKQTNEWLSVVEEIETSRKAKSAGE